jgi:hypothetical protein
VGLYRLARLLVGRGAMLRHVCIAARIRKLLASRVAKRPFIEPLRHMAGAMCCIGLLLYVFLCQR